MVARFGLNRRKEKAPPFSSAYKRRIEVAAKKICLVEDSDLDYELAELAALEVIPEVQVLRARDCREGTSQIVKHRPSLVLLDLNLLRCNGLQVLSNLSALKLATLNDIAVVVFTTSNNPTDRQQALNAGANDFRSKPTDPEMFLSTVRDVVRHWIA
jgi:DNA-binding response OmpR family regulator